MSHIITLLCAAKMIYGGKKCYCHCYDIPIADTTDLVKSIINLADVIIVSESNTPELISDSILGMVDSAAVCASKRANLGAKTYKCA